MGNKMLEKDSATPGAKTLERMQLELRETLEQLCRTEEDPDKIVELVAFGSRNDDLRAMFRVHDEAKWLKVLTAYLAREEGSGWYSFWGKKYMLKEGRLVYGWNVVIAADQLDDAIQQTRRMLVEADHEVNAASRRTVTEIPLPSDLGYSPEQQARVKPTAVSPRLR